MTMNCRKPDPRTKKGEMFLTNSWPEIIGLIVLATILFGVLFFISGTIVLWALNILGVLEPFAWEKAFAIGVLLVLLGGVSFKKRR